MTRPTWFDPTPYLGRPFDEESWNCWILVATVLQECFGVDVPTWKPAWPGAGARGEVEDAIARERLSFVEVTAGGLQAGDIVLIRIMREACHVGVLFSPWRMLHVMERTQTYLADLNSPEWRPRIVSYHRHPDLARA